MTNMKYVYQTQPFAILWKGLIHPFRYQTRDKLYYECIYGGGDDKQSQLNKLQAVVYLSPFEVKVSDQALNHNHRI